MEDSRCKRTKKRYFRKKQEEIKKLKENKRLKNILGECVSEAEEKNTDENFLNVKQFGQLCQFHLKNKTCLNLLPDKVREYLKNYMDF